MWVLMMIAAPIAFMAAFMSETSKSRILYLRHKRSGAKIVPEGDTGLSKRLQRAFVRPVHMMLVEVCI